MEVAGVKKTRNISSSYKEWKKRKRRRSLGRKEEEKKNGRDIGKRKGAISKPLAAAQALLTQDSLPSNAPSPSTHEAGRSTRRNKC